MTSVFQLLVDPPEGITVEFSYADTSVTIVCKADALPVPTYKILLNGSLFASGKTYTIRNMTDSFVGNYSCVVKNILGRRLSPPRFLPIKSKAKSYIRIFLFFCGVIVYS